MSTTITADVISTTSVRRTIPYIYRWNSVNVSCPNTTQTRVPLNSVAESKGDTPLTWDSSNNQFINESGGDLLVLATYTLRWEDQTMGNQSFWSHSAWFRVQRASGSPVANTYGKTTIPRPSIEPCQCTSVVVLMYPNDRISLEVYQNNGFTLFLVSTSGARSPSVSLTLI